MSKKNKSDRSKSGGAETEENLKGEIHQQSLKILKCLPALGPVLLLYMQSAHRRYQFVADLEWLLMPPLIAGQCKLYMKKEYPVSFVSWAFLNREAEKRLLQNGGRLRPDDWNCGDRLWVIDMVAPFGGVENMLRDLQVNEFPGRVISLAAPDPKTGGITVRTLQPLKDRGTQTDEGKQPGETIQ